MTHPTVLAIINRIVDARWKKAGSNPNDLTLIRTAVTQEVDVATYAVRLFDAGNDKSGKQPIHTLSAALHAVEKWEKSGPDRHGVVSNCAVRDGRHDVRFMLQSYEFFADHGALGRPKPNAEEEEDGPQLAPQDQWNLNPVAPDDGLDIENH